MADLMGQGLPGFLGPVETLGSPGQGLERPVIEHHPALEMARVAVIPGHRNALTEGPDAFPLGMDHGPGRDHHLGDAVEELGGDFTGLAADHYLEILQAH